MRVYLDLALILNFLVDFLLLMGTNRLAGYPARWKQSLPAAALGGIYGAACLMPGFSFLGNFLWRTVSLCLMAALAFGLNRSALQRGAVFILLTMALGGIASGFSRNSFTALLLAAGLMFLLCRVSFRGNLGQKEYIPVRLQWEEKSVNLIALRDTGNLLRDPLTGEQVLVAGADVGMELLGLTARELAHPVETLASGKIPGLRLIPYHGVGQSGGFLPAVRFRGVKIGETISDPLVAFAPDVLARGEVYRMLAGGAV